MKQIISLLAVLALISCNTPKRLERKKIKAEKHQTEALNYRLSVSFISRGSGTDSKAKKAFDTYLADYNAKNKVNLAYESRKWGREGEMDYCFKLEELKAKEQTSFISGLKEALKDSNLVLYQENAPCRESK